MPEELEILQNVRLDMERSPTSCPKGFRSGRPLPKVVWLKKARARLSRGLLKSSMKKKVAMSRLRKLLSNADHWVQKDALIKAFNEIDTVCFDEQLYRRTCVRWLARSMEYDEEEAAKRLNLHWDPPHIGNWNRRDGIFLPSQSMDCRDAG